MSRFNRTSINNNLAQVFPSEDDIFVTPRRVGQTKPVVLSEPLVGLSRHRPTGTRSSLPQAD